ncbi:GNAT family N-acetyltransferase [Streptomyces sp. NBC_01433]|uniref:GNAT family N-acetyltransferase n=1 Tax=Streptomyces sp. NBC_01433 TaxID=2903864 RepID=UPI00224F940D|nr:GNAT family N-acetyltransferase [Streptomyces sp. NBC_01433]MCX4681385.1 GNAT family N-acetyltransferase [Streptomyces sp. NBC_01433]
MTALAPNITIRPVRASEVDVFRRLTLFIDLKLTPDQLPRVFEDIHMVLQHEGEPFSHGLHHFLLAETSDGTPVAAAHTGPPLWMFRNPSILPHMQSSLLRRISNIDTIAVDPAYRGQGIARSLLSRVEDDFRNAGYAALTLRHEQDKKHFFTRHGFTSFPRLAMDLPPVGLVTEADRAWKFAVKPLTNDVSFTTMRGLTAVTGLLH